MKYIAIILLVLCGFVTKAQLPANPTPTQFSTGYFRQGWHKADSGYVFAVRDTNFTPRYVGTTIYWLHAGVDTAQWIWNGHWVKNLTTISPSATTWGAITGTLSNQTDLQNALNLKLNAADTSNKWINNIRRQPGSLNVEIFKNGSWTTAYTDSISSGGGTGTVTSVGLSMPSAFTVGGTNPVTSSGAIAVSGAGTTADYIRGNGTLATTDTGMIPNFYLKVRGLLSGTSPITFNQTTGIIGVLRANNTGQLGVATFNNSDFIDNGAGLISLRSASGGGGVDTIYRTPGIDSIYFVIGSDTSAILDSIGQVITANNGLTKTGNNIQLGGTLVQSTSVTTGSFTLTATGSGVTTFQGLNSSNGVGVKGLSTTGTGVFGVSTSSDAVNGTSTSGTGVAGVSNTGNAYAFTIIPSTTNTLEEVGRTLRFSTGTAANGIGGYHSFYTQSSNGSAQRSNYIASLWTNATSASRTSQLELYGVNNAVEARKAALAGNGQWTWDGYPSLTAQTDTTTYKPVAIDASGNVVKMIGWAGGGGGGATFPNGLLAATSNTPRVANDSDVVNTLNQYPSLHNSIYCLPTDSVVFVGDSYTYGTGASNPALKFSSWLSRSIGAIEVNLGVAGSTISKQIPVDPFGGVNLIDRLSTIPHNSFKIKLLIIAMGLNDVGMANATNYTTTNYKTDYDSAMNYITGTLGYTPQKILIISPWYIGYTGYVSYNAANLGNGLPTVARHLQFVDATQQTATKWRTMYFDMYQDQIKNDTTLLGLDGIHPNDAGYLYIANDFKQYVSSIGNIILGDYNAFSVSSPTSIDLGAHYSNDVGNPAQLKLFLYRDINNPNVNFGLEVATATMGYHAGGSSSFHRWYINDNVQRMRLGQDGLLIGSNVSTFGTTTPIYLDLGGTFTTVINDTNNMKFRLYSVVGNGAAGMNISSNDGSLTGNVEYMGAYNMRHIWYRGPQELMRIDTSGNVLINSNTDNHVGKLQVNGKLTVSTHAIGSNSDSAVIWDRSTNEYKYAKINGTGGTTIYSGDGTLAGNRTVTGNNLSLTFDTIFNFRVNANTFILAQKDKKFPYTNSVIGVDPHNFQLGYTPTPTVYSKGAGLYIDTNNNIGLGVLPSSSAPLYATGNSAYVQGFQSSGGNFYKVGNQTSNYTVTLTDNFITIDATGGNVTLTLPAASTAFGNNLGIDYIFKRLDNSGNTITIQRNGTPGTDTIDGASSFTLTTQYESKKIRATSTSAWSIY